MDRKFSEVFGELGLRKDIAEFFSDVTVSKVSKVTARRLLRVYITYDRMIMKDRIIALEAELARVLCGDSNWQVQVCEDYHLSSQYSTQYVVDNYYPSVLMEIDRHDKMIHTVLRNCKPEVIDGRLIVSLPDTFVAHKREEEICSIFSHSPVFRVGGDEFVAFLTGVDFYQRKELMEQIKRLGDGL